jgi:hypothetical protein
VTLEQRIASIVAQDCLSPRERAAMILAQPDIAHALQADTDRLKAVGGEIRGRLDSVRRFAEIAFEEPSHGQSPA